MLKEILHALNTHAEQMNTKFEQLEKKFDQKFDQLEKKVDGIRMDLTDTQKTTNFLLGKVAQHDDKLLQLAEKQQ